MSKRKLEETVTAEPDGSDVTTFETRISSEKPLADYIQLIRAHVQSDKIISDDVLKANFNKISAVTRDVIWQLLFGREKHDSDGSSADTKAEADSSNSHTDGCASADSTATQLIKAAELLEEYKCDACFYSPWEYNEWILTVRDELLKRQMFDFWRNAIVKKELGPCWAKDSDLFDDFEDTEPAAFYAHAGCLAPFAKEAAASADQQESEDGDEAQTQQRSTATTTTTDANEAANNVVSTTTSNITNTNAAAASNDLDADEAEKQLAEAKVSDDNPLIDYQDLMQKYVRSEEIFSDEILNDNFNKIADAARVAIWRFLFTTPKPSEIDLAKAGELLEEHKGDACFYGPYEYNTWVVKLRDELLKRDMLEFWRETVVKLELGPCWAKDSDYFDDIEDPEPLAFYAHGGCKAPFAEQQQHSASSLADDEDNSNTAETADACSGKTNT